MNVRTLFFAFFAAISFILLSAVNPPNIFAQWSTTPAIDNVIANGGGSQLGPAMVTDADRGAIIAWQDRVDYNQPSTLFVQRLDKLGYLRWGTTGVAICSTMYRYGPRFTMTDDLDGGAFIVWCDERLAPRYKLFAQHIDSNGVALWQDQGVVVSDTANAYSDLDPQIVRDDSGGVFVVFYHGDAISAQRINSNGTRRWTPTDKAVTPGGGDDRAMKMVKDGSGVVVVWRSWGFPTIQYPIMAQRMDQDGNNLWLAPKVVASPGSQGDYTIAPGDSIAGGNKISVAVAWSSDPTLKIYAQALDTAGTRLWGSSPVPVCIFDGQHAYPRIINDRMQIGDSSSYYITWQDGRRSGVNGDIRAQRLNAAGVPQWETDGMLISDKPNFYSSPSITGLPDGSVVIASYDGRPEGSGIYAHRIARNGTKLWDTSGVYISVRSSLSVLHTTSDVLSESGVIFAFTGVGDGGGDNIYAKLVNADGLFPPNLRRVNMLNSWNLISIPLTVSDFRKSVLFPTSVTSAFAYGTTGYISKDTLQNGAGYWLKFSADQSVYIYGQDRSYDTIPINLGWNMIGTITKAILTSSITSIPGGIVTSNFFGYDIAYFSEDTLQPGKGYWVKTTSAGTLILSSTGQAPQENRIRIVPTNELPPAPPDGEIPNPKSVFT